MKKIVQPGYRANALFGCVFLFLLFAGHRPAEPNWKLRVEKSGIKVYTRAQADSDFDALRTTFEAEATLDQYTAVVLDIDAYKYWNSAATNAYVLKKISDSEQIYYTEAKAPWPVADRYLVLHMKVTRDEASKVMKIALDNVPDQIPQKDGFVRVKKYRVTATITAVSDTRVKADYYYDIDPGGSVPAWAINLVSSKMPVEAFTNLKDRIKALSEEKTLTSFHHSK